MAEAHDIDYQGMRHKLVGLCILP